MNNLLPEIRGPQGYNKFMNFTTPILPIPNLVFFPNTIIPLYIVEKSYINMIRQSIANQGPITLVQATPTRGSFSQHVQYIPKMIGTSGIPEIIDEYPDGSIKILIRGTKRVLLKNVIQNIPHLVYEVEALPDLHSEDFPCENKIERLGEILNWWMNHSVKDSREREALMREIKSIHHVLDYISAFIIQDQEMKQMILENRSLADRIQILHTLLPSDEPTTEDFYTANAIKVFETIEKTYKLPH